MYLVRHVDVKEDLVGHLGRVVGRAVVWCVVELGVCGEKVHKENAQ